MSGLVDVDVTSLQLIDMIYWYLYVVNGMDQDGPYKTIVSQEDAHAPETKDCTGMLLHW